MMNTKQRTSTSNPTLLKGGKESAVYITGFSLRAPEHSQEHFRHSVPAFAEGLLAGSDMTSPTKRYKQGHMSLPPRTGTIPEDIIDKFDHEFFGLNLKQAENMDVGIRLLLEVTQEALMDSKSKIQELRGSNTGVFIGHCFSDHFTGSLAKENLTGYEVVNSSQNMAANRISFFYDFHGPSMTINTACSSSMNALDLAVKAIERGEIDRAIVGGLSITTDPRCSSTFNKFKMLSATGQCRTFDESCNGYCRSEGVAVTVLESSRVCNTGYAKVLSVGVNCDGHKAAGITRPSWEAQSKLFSSLLDQAGGEKLVGYVEAHGTGTVEGDASEMRALDAVFSDDVKGLPIGSLKSNMGHAEGASGIMGIIKVLLMYETKKLFPNLHFESTRHKPLISGKFQVVTTLQNWEPKASLICNYGFGGTNAAALLAPCSIEWHKEIVDISTSVRVASFGRQKHLLESVPRALSFWDKEQISLGNDSLFRIHSLDGAKVSGKVQNNADLAFVFDGQGSQWPHMGKHLLHTNSVFHDTIQRLSNFVPDDLVELYQDGTRWFEKEKTVIGLVSYQIGMIHLLQSKGVNPTAFIGHSLGEISAGYLAGLQSLEQTMRICLLRSELAGAIDSSRPFVLSKAKLNLEPVHFNGKPVQDLYYLDSSNNDYDGNGAVFETEGLMVAVLGLSLESLRCYMQEMALKHTSIACNNGERNQTLSGPKEEVLRLCSRIRQVEPSAKLKELETGAIAYHSPIQELFRDVLEENLREILGNVDEALPDSWILTSNNRRFTPSFHANNITGMVRFHDAVSKLKPGSCVVEIGPNNGLLGLVRRSRKDIQTANLVTANQPEDVDNMCQSLWDSGVRAEVRKNTREHFQNRYPLLWDHSKTHHVFGPTDYQQIRKDDDTPKPAQPVQQHDSDMKMQFDLTGEWASLRGHMVTGRALFPAAGYVYVVWESMRASSAATLLPAMQIKDLRIISPLVIDPKQKNIEFSLSTVSRGDCTDITISNASKVVCSCSCIVTASSTTTIDEHGQQSAPSTFDDKNAIPSKQFYSYARKFGLYYDGSFKGIEKIDFKSETAVLSSPVDWISYLDVVLHPLLLRASTASVPIGFGEICLSQCKSLDEADRISRYDDSLRQVGNKTVLFRNCKMTPMGQSKSMRYEKKCGEKGWLIYGANDISDIKYLNQVFRFEGSLFRVEGESSASLDLIAEHLLPTMKETDDENKAVVTICGNDLQQVKTPFVLSTRAMSGDKFIEILRFCESNVPRIYLYRNADHNAQHERNLWVNDWQSVQQAPQGTNVWWFNAAQGESVVAPVRSLYAEGWSGTRAVQLLGNQTSVSESFKSRIESMKMTLNVVLPDGRLAFPIERNLVPSPAPKDCGFHLAIDRPGDLSSFKWVQATGSVSVSYAALNFRDVMRAYGRLRENDQTLGLEFAGVDANGNRVCGVARSAIGSRCEPVYSFPVPEGMSLRDAATIPIVYLTAYHALFDKANLKKGQTVLIHAGAGGVGIAAIQLCKCRGIKVYTTCSSKKRSFLMQKFGLSDAEVFDSRSKSFRDDVLRATQGRGVDAVLNSLAGDLLSASLECVSSGGSFLEIGKYDVMENSKIGMQALEKNISFHVIDLLDMLRDPSYTKHWDRHLSKGVSENEIIALPSEIFSAEQTVEAFRHMSKGGHIGKILVDMTSPLFSPQVCPRFFTSGTHLITGGLGGFGLELAKRLADRGCRDLILCGRSGVSTAWQQRQLTLIKCPIRIIEKSVEDLEHQGDLECVWHLSGVYHDSLFKNMTDDKWNGAHSPKVAGYKNLRDLYPTTRLVCFSSVAAGHGHAGQSNYAAANECMEVVADARNDDTLLIQWGAVDNVGKAAAMMDGLTKHTKYELENVELLLDFLDDVQSKRGVVMRYGLKKKPAQRLTNSPSRERFTSKQPTKHLTESRRGLTTGASLTIQNVQEQLALVLGGTIRDYPPHQPLHGIDSLSAMELVGWLNQNTASEVTASFLSESITPKELLQHLLSDPAASQQKHDQHKTEASNSSLDEYSTESMERTAMLSESSIDTKELFSAGTTPPSSFSSYASDASITGAADDKDSIAQLLSEVQSHLADVLGGKSNDYLPDQPLHGIDSLSAMEIVSFINNHQVSEEVTASFLSESVTPRDIVNVLVSRDANVRGTIATPDRPNQKETFSTGENEASSTTTDEALPMTTNEDFSPTMVKIGIDRTLNLQLFQRIETAVSQSPSIIVFHQKDKKVFCEGLPIHSAAATELPSLMDAFVRVCHKLQSFKGTIACYVNGIVRGGGMAFLGVSDVCYCTSVTTGAFPEIAKHSIIPAVVSSVLNGRVQSRALRTYFATGEIFDAKVALSIGLCDRVLKQEEFEQSQQTLLSRSRLFNIMKEEKAFDSTDPRALGTTMGNFMAAKAAGNSVSAWEEKEQSSEAQVIHVEWRGQVAVIVMSDVVGKNSFSNAMALQLKQMIPTIAKARAIVLHSSLENVFHVGANPSFFRRMKGKNVCTAAAQVRSLYDSWLSLFALNVPVVAVMHGKVYGGGLPLCLWADYRIASASLDVHFGNVSRGMSPAAQLSSLLRDHLSAGAIMDLYLNNSHWGSDQCLQEGLVQQVMPTKEEALEEALTLSQFIASKEAFGLQNTLHLVKSKQRMELVNVEAWLIAEAAVAGKVFTDVSSIANKSSPVRTPTSSPSRRVSVRSPQESPQETRKATPEPQDVDFGIVAMAPFVPAHAITAQEMRENGLKPDFFMQKAVSVWDNNEDAISMALSATKSLLSIMKNNGIDIAKVGRVEVGSESNVDMAKSIKSYITDLLPGNKELEGADNVSACYGGTAALLNTLAWLREKSRNGQNFLGIVVATDTSNMDESQMCWMGCGAMAMLVGPNPSILIHPERVSFFQNTHDFFQPRFSMKLSPDIDGRTSMNEYEQALKYTSTKMKERHHISLANVEHVAIHGGLSKSVIARAMTCWSKWEMMSRKDVEAKYMCSTHHAEQIGAQYTASLYFNLHSVLEHSQRSESFKMLLFSFGSGCSATMLYATVLRKPIGFEPLSPTLSSRTNLSYSTVCGILSSRRDTRKSNVFPRTSLRQSISSSFYLTSSKPRRYEITLEGGDTPTPVSRSESMPPLARSRSATTAPKPHRAQVVYPQSKRQKESCTYGLIPAWSSNLELVLTQMSKGKEQNLVDVALEDVKLEDARQVTVGGQKLLNFGLCSYSGLHLNPKLIAGAKLALDTHGVQFSCSRAYLSTSLNQELESLMDELTGGHTVVAQTTTLIHMATMPTFIHENDIVLIDRQAHASIQMVAKILRCHGTHIQIVPHNDVSEVERVVTSEKTRNVWYLADGIYSMYGDYAPLEQLCKLQKEHENLHLYIDDAHGISWCGKHGRGYALEFFNDNASNTDRVIVVSSLSKAFGAGGGLAVLPSEEMRNKVLRVGGPMVFGGPLQSPVLGALIESAKLHLSDEIHEVQENVLARVDLCNRLLRQHKLPIVSYARIPIKFLACGPLVVARKLSNALKKRGFLVNVASFPAVPMDKSGIRFTLHNWLRSEDITRLVQAMAELLPKFLEEHGRTVEDIEGLFKMKTSAVEIPDTTITLESPSDSKHWQLQNHEDEGYANIHRQPHSPNHDQPVEMLSDPTPTTPKDSSQLDCGHAKEERHEEPTESSIGLKKKRGKRTHRPLQRLLCRPRKYNNNFNGDNNNIKSQQRDNNVHAKDAPDLSKHTAVTEASTLTQTFTSLGPIRQQDGRNQYSNLILEHHNSIHNVNKAEWDKLIGCNSSTDSTTLALLEEHHGNDKAAPEMRWKFHYLMVREATSGQCILASLFTETLWKDDMMESERVSEMCEQERCQNPLYQTSRVLMMGSMFTLGDSLWIDASNSAWPRAFGMLLDRMDEEQKACGAKMLCFQSVESAGSSKLPTSELVQILEDEGFVSKAQPSLLFSRPCGTEEEYLQSMKKGYRSHLNKHVLKSRDAWEFRVLQPVDLDENPLLTDHLLGLYHRVQKKARKFNTFPLNDNVLRGIMRKPQHWEFLLIYSKNESNNNGQQQQLPQAFVACAKRAKTYAALFCGLEYHDNDQQQTGAAYRQMLYEIVRRARELGYHDNDDLIVQMGLTSEREKKRVGCFERSAALWMRIQDPDLEGAELLHRTPRWMMPKTSKKKVAKDE